MLKLFLLSLSYIALSVLGYIAASKSSSVNLKNIDVISIGFVCFALLLNLIGFIVNVYKSEAYRDYQISKKNEEIMERNKRQNETRQKIYNKNETSQN